MNGNKILTLSWRQGVGVASSRGLDGNELAGNKILRLSWRRGVGVASFRRLELAGDERG